MDHEEASAGGVALTQPESLVSASVQDCNHYLDCIACNFARVPADQHLAQNTYITTVDRPYERIFWT
jgi:hypothetical protein